jgi:hypothetical protein
MTTETFGRFGTMAIFDFESKSAQIAFKSKSLPKSILVKKQPKTRC